MIQFKGQYQLSDFRAAQKLHAQRGWLLTWVGYFVLGIFAVTTLFGAILALLTRFPWPLLVPPVIALGIWSVFQFILMPRRLERVFAQQKELSAPFTAELGDESFELSNDFGSSRIPWQDFVKWKENSEFLLLYRSDYVFHMLPKRIFDDQGGIEFALGRLRVQHVPDASKGRRPIQLVIFGVVGVLVAYVIVVMIGVVLLQILRFSAR